MTFLRHGEFLGREINRVSVPGFIVTFRHSGSDRRDEKPHCHGNPNLLLPLDSGFWSQSDGFDEHNPLQIFYTPAGTGHRDSMVRLGGRYLSISIENSIMEDCACDLRFPVAIARPRATRIAHALAIRNIQGDLGAPFVEDACLNLVAEVDLDSRGGAGSRPNWLNRVVELCHGDLEELPSISRIGGIVGIHPVHITRVFRNFYGVPLSKYILSVKVGRAAAALRSGKASVAAAAAQAGFSDQSHLCRSFKSVMGIAPGEYKNLFH